MSIKDEVLFKDAVFLIVVIEEALGPEGDIGFNFNEFHRLEYE